MAGSDPGFRKSVLMDPVTVKSVREEALILKGGYAPHAQIRPVLIIEVPWVEVLQLN